MTTAKDDIKRIDSVLYSWGKWVKSGGSLKFLGYPTSSPFVIKGSGVRVDDIVMTEVDCVIGRLEEPYKRIIRRAYLDERPHNTTRKDSNYYTYDRTQKEMAKTEKMTVANFSDVLRMARHRLIGALQHLL